MKDCTDLYHERKRNQRLMAYIDITEDISRGVRSSAIISILILGGGALATGAAAAAGIVPGLLVRNLPITVLALDGIDLGTDIWSATKPLRNVRRQDDAHKEFLDKCIANSSS